MDVEISPWRYWSVADMRQFSLELFPLMRQWGWPVLANLEDRATGLVWFAFDVPVARKIPLSFYESLQHAFTSLPAGVSAQSLDPYKLGAFVQDGPPPVPNEDSVFRGGTWYTTTIPTELYSAPNSPLDQAIQQGYVFLGEAANFGQSASWIWIKIYVKKNLGGPLGEALFSWGFSIQYPKPWTTATPGTSPEADIPQEARGEAVIFKIADNMANLPAGAANALAPLKPVLYVIGGLLVLGLVSNFFTFAATREQRLMLQTARRR